MLYDLISSYIFWSGIKKIYKDYAGYIDSAGYILFDSARHYYQLDVRTTRQPPDYTDRAILLDVIEIEDDYFIK